MGAAFPSVSVVVATRDRPALLADALAAVGAQTAPPLEVCVADDGTAPLDEIPAAGRVPVRVVRCGAGSISAARNLAARAARGEWLAFLDDDDRWLPGHLAGMVPALAAGTAILYRDVAVVKERIAADGARTETARRVIAREWDLATMRTDDYIAPSALAVSRALFERLGGFDEGLRYSEDWDLLLRAARLATPRRVPGVTVEVRLRGHGNASRERGAERRACLDALSSRHGLPALAVRTFWEVAALVGRGEAGT